jgi:hypothetical protein
MAWLHGFVGIPEKITQVKFDHLKQQDQQQH